MGDLLTMKSTNDIYMNYQVMQEKAERLEELANELRSVAEKSIGYYGEKRDSWKGDSADECRKKVIKLKNNIDRRASELQKAATRLRNTAKRQYELEMRMAQLFSH